MENESNLLWLALTKAINVVNITGNPFAMTSRGNANYQNLEYELQKNLSAVLINDTHLLDERSHFKKKATKNHWPYPNPIKLLSREVQKEIKGDYLNAEVMRKGIALPISDIRPNTNIENEIFPRQLTKEAQAKDVFTPPGHPQMRFAQDDMRGRAGGEEAGFFITEDIREEQLHTHGVE